MNKYYVDYRFIVRAKDEYEAAKKADELISWASDDVWYTIDKITLVPKGREE